MIPEHASYMHRHNVCILSDSAVFSDITIIHSICCALGLGSVTKIIGHYRIYKTWFSPLVHGVMIVFPDIFPSGSFMALRDHIPCLLGGMQPGPWH